MTNNDFLSLLTMTKRYLSQQGELFGNELHFKEAALIEKLTAKTDEEWTKTESLESFSACIADCQKCPELVDYRKQVVFGVGNPNADLLLIGEAPGANEDIQGEPFVGRAGQLLNKILTAIDLRREDVYIANILKCRPPNNRDPLTTEIDNCESYLLKQIAMIKPKVILALGRFAGQTLLKTNDSLSALRGKIHDYHGVKLIVTYHPAALLRNPHWKRPTWEDMKMTKKLFDELTR